MREVERTHFVAGAKPRELFDIVTDYDNYPRYFPDFTGARVLSRNGDKRAKKASVRSRWDADLN